MKIYRTVFFISLFLLFNMIISCNKEEYSLEIETEERDKFIEDNNITTEPTASGLYYIETLEGSGRIPVPGDIVEVIYKGTFLDGEEFDSGTFSFELGVRKVIRGWDEGIAYMKEGGKAILIIPSTLGYGIYGSGKIQPYTTLRFEVELIDIR